MDTHAESSITQDLAAERFLLGCIMRQNNLIEQMRGITPQSFYSTAHHVMFDTMQEMCRAGTGIDVITLGANLKARGVWEKAGASEELARIWGEDVYLPNALEYAKAVKDAAARRALRSAVTGLMDDNANPTVSPADALGHTIEMLQKQAAESADSRISPWVDATELTATEHKAPEQLVDGLLMTHSVAVLAAAPKVGKTFLGLEFALSLACGRPFLGRYKTHKARTAYIALEDGEESIGERLHALSGDIYPALGDFLVRCRRTGKAFDLLDGANLSEIIAQCKGFGLIVIDSLRRAHKLAEDSSQDAAAVGAAVWRLCNETGATVLLIHHLVKNWDPDADVFTRIRGSGDIFADCDTALVLDRKRGEDWVELQCVHRRMVEPTPFCFKRVHGENGSITWGIKDETLAVIQRQEHTISVEHQIIDLVTAQPGLNAREIRHGCHGRGQDVDNIRRWLVEQGTIRVEKHGGSVGDLHYIGTPPELFEPGSNG
jgi:replicative DNA helicase